MVAHLLLLIAEKTAASLISNWIKKNGKVFLGTNQEQFKLELTHTICETIKEFELKYSIQEEYQKFPFYHSEILLETLLSIKFIGVEKIDVVQLEQLLNQNPNIIQPTKIELVAFIELFKDKCTKNDILKKHQFNDNYREAIFIILDVIISVQSTLNKVILEMKSSLKSEYFAQLEEIRGNIKSFKPKTALERLNTLEIRIRNNDLFTKEVESSIFFLKGSCLLDIDQQNNEGNELIIKAFLVNENNSFKTEAALAYLNLRELNKAKQLSQELLKTDPYNSIIHLILVVVAGENYKETIQNIPKPAIVKRGLQVVLIKHLKQKYNVDDNTIAELGLKLPIEVDEFINHFNIQLWAQVVEIMMSQYFELSREFKMSSNGKIYYQQKEGLDKIVSILEKILDYINRTEISESYNHHRFFYFFIRFLLNDTSFDRKDFDATYQFLKGKYFSYDFIYAQFKGNTEGAESALEILRQSQFSSDRLISLLHIYYERVLNHIDISIKLFREYVSNLSSIDFHGMVNISGILDTFLPELEVIKAECKNIIQTKNFEKEELKSLFEITVELNFFNENSNNQIERLIILANHFQNDEEVICYITELLFSLKCFDKCEPILKPFVKNGIQSKVNLQYAICLTENRTQLHYLLKFLEEIRHKNSFVLYPFLAIENNLRRDISDHEEIVNIALKGIIQFPEIEHFHLNFLFSLDLLERKDEIEEYVKKYLKLDFKSEKIGVNVAVLLSRNGYNEVAAKLLYTLAENPSNHIARTQYFLFSDFPKDFLIDYDNVQNGSYVKLIDSKRQVKLTVANYEDCPDLIGKKRGDKVLMKEKIGLGIKEMIVERIMNAPLFLLEKIIEEAKNPNSNLPMESLEFTNSEGGIDKEAFERFFIEKFGLENKLRRDSVSEAINNYNEGKESFTYMCRNVFNDNLLECYRYLTAQKFFAIPALINSNIPFTREDTFVLDFTSLIVLYDLSQKFELKFQKKFIVSPNLTVLIKTEILKHNTGSNLSLSVQDGKVIPFNLPENYLPNLVESYTKLLVFIKDNCTEKIIEEKIELLANFDEKRKNDVYFQYLIDNLYFATNLQFTLISNDRIFSQNLQNVPHKQISPELFLLKYYRPEQHSKVAEYFIEKHYVGVIINKNILVNEFKKHQLAQINSFNICLLNLKFRFALSPTTIASGIGFIKELYLSSPISDNERYLQTQTVFVNLLDGFYQNNTIIQGIRFSIWTEFKLLGDALNKVQNAFDSALEMYGIKNK